MTSVASQPSKPPAVPPSAIAAAHDLLTRLGIFPIPVPYGQKGPTLSGWQKLRVTKEQLAGVFPNGKLNVGGLLGTDSRNTIDLDLDSDETAFLAPQLLPATGAIFGRRQRPRTHWLYRVVGGAPGTQRFRDPLRREGEKGHVLLEIRSNGAQTLFPGSIHPTGDVYAWDALGTPAEIERERLDHEAKKLAACALLARYCPDEGGRHDFALALSGGLLTANYPLAQTKLLLGAIASTTGDGEPGDRARAADSTQQKLDRGEHVRSWSSLAGLLGPHGAILVKTIMGWLGVQRRYHFSDSGNAERFADQHGENVRYCWPAEKWSVWSGKHWGPDETGAVVAKAQETVRELYVQAAQTADDKSRAALAGWALKCESASRLTAMLSLARSQPGIPILPQAWDADPRWLNCANGTLDLETLTLHPHRRSDLLTRIAGAPYVPDATDARWDAFLDSALPDGELRHWVQKAAGYSLSGNLREKKLFFPYGPPDAGKSTFLEAIRAALGEYAIGAAFSTWLLHRGEGPRNDLAKLTGRRVVISVEAGKEAPINGELVKAFTGGDTITARFLFHEDFDFRPQGVLWWAANDRPKIRDDDDAMWLRMRAIPFTAVCAPAEQARIVARYGTPAKQYFETDPGAQTAILAWLIEGLRRWQAEGLGECAAVQHETGAYRASMDVFLPFLEERCVLDRSEWRQQPDTGWTAARALRGMYERWCRDNRKRPLTGNEMGSRLRAAGCTSVRRHGMEGWLGIEILDAGVGRMDLSPEV